MGFSRNQIIITSLFVALFLSILVIGVALIQQKKSTMLESETIERQPSVSISPFYSDDTEAYTSPPYLPPNADLNGDGVVDERDEALIRRY